MIIPSLNQGKFIEQAIVSVLSQEVNAELLIIDGGSSDHTIEILKKYSGRIAYWESEKDKGQSDALNKGFKRATGEIITWLNSDDLYEPGALKKVQAQFTSQPDLDILHGRSVLFGRGKKKIIGPSNTLLRWQYLPYMRFPQPSSFFRHTLLKKLLPVNEELHFAMDHELIVKAILLNANLQGTDEVFSHYRLHRGSKSMDESKFAIEWGKVFANALRSAGGPPRYNKILASFAVENPNTTQEYPVAEGFNEEELKQALLEHLNLRFHSFYRIFDKENATRVLAEIRMLDPDFAEKNLYKKYLTRLRFIPKFMFSVLRSLKR